MATEWTNPAACNCLALRQAARHVSQLYDQFLAPHGLRATQYSILARLQRRGTMSINLLAAELVMDRTTLGRNILPLQREGLISISPGRVKSPQQEIATDQSGRRTLSRRAQRLAASAGAVRGGIGPQMRRDAARAPARCRHQ